MNRKYLNNVELNKIQQMAAEYAVCEESKQNLLDELPCTDAGEVNYLLAQTDFLATLLLKNSNPKISSCPGAKEAVKRAEKGGKLSMSELLAVGGALRNFSRLVSWFEADEDEGTPVDDLFYTITPQPVIEKDIFDKILSDTDMADTASNTLFDLRRKIRSAELLIQNKLDSIVKNQNNSRFLQEALISVRSGRYVIPVKAEHKNEIGGIIHDVSQSGGTIFVEPAAVVEANAKIMQLKNKEREEIERILGELTERVEEIAPMFMAAYEAMLEIDKRLGKAELGLIMKGVCPKINNEMNFSLFKARHPLLNKDLVVPVDICLGKDCDAMIITGPNTGGKTVSLKTAGLLCAMAQCGYLLPAHDSSSVCVFEKILVDIGDEQSIEQSLSTFSGHIKNITDILKKADSKSLVLLDELGAGTDPAEGAALAVSIIENIRSCGARLMATTHYSELKMFAIETQGVQNASSEFNVETLRPTYKLIVGVPGRSNAFLISEKLGIPEQIIENARKHMSGEQRRFESVLSQLEDLKLEMHEKEEQIKQLENTAEKQYEKAREKYDALIKQGENELEMARNRAKALTDEVNDKAYALMDEIKRLEKDDRIANQKKAQRAREIARNDAQALETRYSKDGTPEKMNYTPLTAAAAGQEVFIPEMSKKGVIISGPDKAGLFEVRVGAAKTKMPLMKLAAAPKANSKEKMPAKGGVGVKREFTARAPASEINLLGKTVEEALMDVDIFLDGAVMTGLGTVYIIHGRGTGALRSAITRHLRGHRNVVSHRLGVYGEGEDGVTVVELK